MRLVDVVLYARDANQNALLLEIYVSELNLTPEDIRRLWAIAALRENLNDNTYCKLIER